MPGDEFLRQLRATFMVEAREHLQTLSRGLVELEKSTEARQQSSLVDAVFRAAHSLKGAARAVELAEIEAICQSLEDVFAARRRERGTPPPEVMDLLHRAVDAIEAQLAGLAGSSPPVPPSEVLALRKELRRHGGAPGALQMPPRPAALAVQPAPSAALAVQASPPAALPPAQTPYAAAVQPAALVAEDTVRVALPKLQAQLLDTEELLVAKLAAGQRVADLRALQAWFAQWRRQRSAIEPDLRALRQQSRAAGDGAADAAGLARLLEFFDWSETAVRALEGRFSEIGRSAQHDRDAVAKSVDQLLENAKKLLLLPFGTVSASFPKLVRDLCRTQGKEAEFSIAGEHVELDKRILEEIKDPLVHMLRNAVDHGLEPPALRAGRGKSPRASIVLTVTQAEGNRVQIVLSDDGGGIATEQLRAAAVRRGVLTQQEADALDEAAAQALVFASEVSTGAVVTQVSGRGLGLAIVREHVSRLGGEVRVQSRSGQGTTFTIVLPALRATFRGILCRAADRSFLLPVAQVERVARVHADTVRTVEGRETTVLGGRAVALVHLADVLELPRQAAQAQASLQVLLVASGEQAVAFAVDEVLEEQEVLVKPLSRPLVRVRNVAAAALLGSGQVVPILNVADLMKSARRPAVLRSSPLPRQVHATVRSILVAEDSITSRMLLKTILESAGYAVRTAVDGMEAFALLRSEHFDLLVSDVEMPRLNGFDLTARVRADKKLAELPVVLVTALATREDRERGIDVGANAYIVKGSFDQDNLIEAVERLL